MKYNKILVVGAGLSGATIARLFAEDGYNVTVVDKRQNIGGNVYDYQDKNGIIVQKYGPHIFHTNNQEVYNFLSRFTEWHKYEHRVVAKIKNQFVPVPFNLTSLEMLFPVSKAQEIYDVLVEEYGLGNKVPILQLKAHQNPKIRDFADFVYDNIFYKYTKKQWNMKPEKLGDKVMGRVPVYVSHEDRYFTDKFQYMPVNGFARMIKNMLAHPNIKIQLNTDFIKNVKFTDNEMLIDGITFDGLVIYTGRTDELFGYKLGELPYRSLRFKFRTLRKSSYQPDAVVNYTASKRWTRITEFTKFTCEEADKTVICKEFSKQCKKHDIPYYPIQVSENQQLFEQYKALAEKYSNLKLLGRLANYKYINMDVAVEDAIALYNGLK